MHSAPIEFPLTLRPMVRCHERGDPNGRRLPYHGVVLILDRAGREVLHIAPNTDDLVAGRVSRDPHQLVARASRLVIWLHNLYHRIEAWIAGLEHSPELVLRPVIAVLPGTSKLEAGVQFSTGSGDEFDRLTRELHLLAEEDELARSFDPLREQVRRHYDSALALLTSLQDAVQSWRVAEALATDSGAPVRIEDTEMEH